MREAGSPDLDRLTHLIAQEVHPRQDEDIAWHRAQGRRVWAALGCGGALGLSAGAWVVDLGGPGPAGASGALVVLSASATVVATRWWERRARRHTCFDAHAYLAMRMREPR